jgi:hypothetical protein
MPPRDIRWVKRLQGHLVFWSISWILFSMQYLGVTFQIFSSDFMQIGPPVTIFEVTRTEGIVYASLVAMISISSILGVFLPVYRSHTVDKYDCMVLDATLKLHGFYDFFMRISLTYRRLDFFMISISVSIFTHFIQGIMSNMTDFHFTDHLYVFIVLLICSLFFYYYCSFIDTPGI